MDKYTFFWSGVFSNWHPSIFTVDGIKYNCGEQYMMYQKALLFGDKEIAKAVLLEKEPRNQKALGRKIRNFDADKWNEVSFDLIKKGLREKFEQNHLMKVKLLASKGRTFVEASPFDRIWGIGYGEAEALNNINNWGENRLGKILTELSRELHD